MQTLESIIETWKPIKGFESLYEVSDLGNVRSMPKYKGKNYCQFMPSRYMKITTDKDGYERISLNKLGVKKTFYMHRLVASAFIENENNFMEVNHIDGVKGNNSVVNLEWCTREMNEQHAYKTGLKSNGYGNVLSKEIAQYTLAGSLVKVYPNARIAEQELGRDASVIRRCARNSIKTAYGYKWAYL